MTWFYLGFEREQRLDKSVLFCGGKVALGFSVRPCLRLLLAEESNLSLLFSSTRRFKANDCRRVEVCLDVEAVVAGGVRDR
jgi:hypothetical protein